MPAVEVDADREPEIVDYCRWFDYQHLQDETLRSTSARFAEVAQALVDELPDSVQLGDSLQALLVSKDAAVRAAMSG